jgi:hypothetical protein
MDFQIALEAQLAQQLRKEKEARSRSATNNPQPPGTAQRPPPDNSQLRHQTLATLSLRQLPARLRTTLSLLHRLAQLNSLHCSPKHPLVITLW